MGLRDGVEGKGKRREGRGWGRRTRKERVEERVMFIYAC